MMSDSYTWYFEEVFKNDNEFNQFLTDYGVSLPLTITYTNLYNLFLNRYMNCSINFDTKEIFKRRFAILLNDYLFEYATRVASINKVYALTESELMVVNTYINNYASNPNYKLTDVYSELEYVGSQNNGMNRISKLGAYINYLKNLLPYGNQEFLDRFKKLFKMIYIRKVDIYENL